MIRDCIALNLDGRATDSSIRCFAGNLLTAQKPVLSIQIRDKETLLWMMPGADDVHVYPASGAFHLNAVYKPTDNFPAARIYFLKTDNGNVLNSTKSYLAERGISLDMVNDVAFSKAIHDHGYPQRFDVWSKAREHEMRSFKGLFEGRRKNTEVDGAIWLSSNGKCLVCGTETNRVSTSTIRGASGLLIGLQLCTAHEAEAIEQSTLMNYVAKQLAGMVMFDNYQTASANDALLLACLVLKSELDCTIEKVHQNTVTAKRPSGVTVIVRCVSPMNYAYNVQAPDGTKLSRVDSANHHNVPYGPDHIHPDLSESMEKIVESSFTYGNVGMDIKLITKMVLDAEAQLGQSRV